MSDNIKKIMNNLNTTKGANGAKDLQNLQKSPNKPQISEDAVKKALTINIFDSAKTDDAKDLTERKNLFVKELTKHTETAGINDLEPVEKDELINWIFEKEKAENNQIGEPNRSAEKGEEVRHGLFESTTPGIKDKPSDGKLSDDLIDKIEDFASSVEETEDGTVIKINTAGINGKWVVGSEEEFTITIGKDGTQTIQIDNETITYYPDGTVEEKGEHYTQTYDADGSYTYEETQDDGKHMTQKFDKASGEKVSVYYDENGNEISEDEYFGYDGGDGE